MHDHMTDEQINRVSVALANACRQEFGSCWGEDVVKTFARAAIEAMGTASDEPTALTDAKRKQALMIAGELGNVRCWMTGYEAGCADAFVTIPGTDSLREAQLFLQDIAR
jgi:hypothetical protein